MIKAKRIDSLHKSALLLVEEEIHLLDRAVRWLHFALRDQPTTAYLLEYPPVLSYLARDTRFRAVFQILSPQQTLTFSPAETFTRFALVHCYPGSPVPEADGQPPVPSFQCATLWPSAWRYGTGAKSCYHLTFDFWAIERILKGAHPPYDVINGKDGPSFVGRNWCKPLR